MNLIKIKEHWNEVANKLKLKYSELTEDDLLFIKGKENELIGRLQVKILDSKQKIKKIISKMKNK